MKNLFDFNGGSGLEVDFFKKLDSVEKDYSKILGEDTIVFVNNLVVEYNQTKNYHIQMNTLIEEQYNAMLQNKAFTVHHIDSGWQENYRATFAKTNMGFDRVYDDKIYQLNKKLETTIGQLRGIVETYIEKTWQIEYDTSNSFMDIEITTNVILDEILKATNDGNFEVIKNQQLMDSIAKDLINRRDVELAKNKVSFARYSYTEKCKYMKRYESRSSDEKIEALRNSLEACFGISKNEKDHVSFYLRKRNEDDGAFDVYTFLSSTIEKLKLLKNGKLEVYFKTEEKARKYFDEYIKPNLHN